MKRFLLALLLLVCATVSSTAQTSMQTITLKNGLKITGEIIENIPGESVAIKTSAGDVFYYRWAEIRRDDDFAKIASANDSSSKGVYNYRGYKGFVDASFNYDISGYSFFEYRLLITTIHGYNFSPKFFMGAGVGLQLLDITYGETVICMPIFANFKYSFLKETRVTPYLSMNIGYNLLMYDPVGYADEFGSPGGLYLEPALGVEFRVSRKNSIILAFSPSLCLGSDTSIGLGGKLGFSF